MVDDTGYMRLVYAKPASDVRLREATFPKQADGRNVIIRKPGHVMPLSSWPASFFVTVMRILGRRPKKKVGRVDTGRNIARVAHKNTVWNFTPPQQPGNPVRGEGFATYVDFSIPVRVKRPRPQPTPAGRLDYASQKPLFYSAFHFPKTFLQPAARTRRVLGDSSRP